MSIEMPTNFRLPGEIGYPEELMGKEIGNDLKKLRKELAEVELYLELKIEKIPKKKLLARKEELGRLIRVYEGLLAETKVLKDDAI